MFHIISLLSRILIINCLQCIKNSYKNCNTRYINCFYDSYNYKLSLSLLLGIFRQNVRIHYRQLYCRSSLSRNRKPQNFYSSFAFYFLSFHIRIKETIRVECKFFLPWNFFVIASYTHPKYFCLCSPFEFFDVVFRQVLVLCYPSVTMHCRGKEKTQ